MIGWLLALFCAWRWLVARRAAKEWEKAATNWEIASNQFEANANTWCDLLERSEAQATEAIRLADEWRVAALTMQAAVLQPMRVFAQFSTARMQ